MANDGDFMDQIFSTVQLPPVKYMSEEVHTSESHIEQSYSSSKMVVTSEEHVHSESVIVSHSHSEHHTIIQDNEAYHESVHSEHNGSESGDDIVNQIFTKPAAIETFKVENGIFESDTDSRAANDEDDKKEEILSSVPLKTKEHDSGETVHHSEVHHTIEVGQEVDDDDEPPNYDAPPIPEDHQYEVPPSQHHYEIPPSQLVYTAPPPEPEPDYESEEEAPSIVHHTYHYDSAITRATELNGGQTLPRDQHSRTSSVSSHQSKASKASKASSRTSKASSVSTLVSQREVPIVVKHKTYEPEDHHLEYEEFERHQSVGELKNFYTSQITSEGKGIYKIREYGTGRRSGTNSDRSSISEHAAHDDHLESEYVIIESREKVVQKPPQRNLHNIPRVAGEIDDEPIMPVGKLQALFGGSGPPVNYVSGSHKLAKRGSNSSSISRASKSTTHSGRNGTGNHTVSQVVHRSHHHGGIHDHNKVPNYHHSNQNQHSVHQERTVQHHGNRKGINSSVSSDSRRSSMTSNTSDASTLDYSKLSDVGKYDSIRVVKNVRSYKEFLDVWSQKELEEAARSRGHGKVKSEPIPRPRYSISARSSYSKVATADNSRHRPSLRPSERTNERYGSGKLDKATSCQTLVDIEERKRRPVETIHEEEEYEVHHSYDRTNGSHQKSKVVREGAHNHPEEYDENAVNIMKLRAKFERGDVSNNSSRRSSNSTVSSIPAVHKENHHEHDNYDHHDHQNGNSHQSTTHYSAEVHEQSPHRQFPIVTTVARVYFQ